MSQSFLSTILIPFIAGLSVSAPRMSLATQLLPSLLALVEIVDKVNCKLMLNSSSGKDKIKKQSSFYPICLIPREVPVKSVVATQCKRLEHSWEIRLHALVVHFTGKLVMLIIAGTPFTATEAALERWLSSRLLSAVVFNVLMT